MNQLNLHTANVAFFEHLRATDVETVGGKNSSLGFSTVILFFYPIGQKPLY